MQRNFFRNFEAELSIGLLQASGLDPTQCYAGKLPQRDIERLASQSDSTFGRHGLDIITAARQILHVIGYPDPGNSAGRIEAGFSSATGSAVFDSVVQSSLISGFTSASDTTVWADESEVQTFQNNERARVRSVENLPRLPRGQGAPHTNLDLSDIENVRVYRFARRFEVDEQVLIDDDVGALTTQAIEMGKAAARLRSDLVYATLLENPSLADGTALFHADHSNLNAGAALSAANLGAACASILNQRENGANLNLQPRWLLVPSSLWITAGQLAQDLQFPSGRNLSVLGEGPIETGLVDPVTETTRAGSASSWYVMASGAPVIEFNYRENRQPTASRYQIPADRAAFGIGWAINWDVSASATDFHGASMNTA